MAVENDHKEIYRKYANYCRLGPKIFNHLYCVVGIVTFCNPIFVMALTGKLVLPYGFKLPWIDEFTFLGYTINLLHHFVQMLVVASLFIYFDGLYSVIVLHVYCIYDVLIQMLDELNELIVHPQSSKIVNEKLISIIQLHQKLLR
jgi:7tm Odorant receptor